MRVISLFAGAGGLDKGFENAGFEVVWANEYDKVIHETYARNHPKTVLNKSSITEVKTADVPDCDGMIGGPPCQSWSIAGSMRGMDDPRGKLFHEYLRILRDKKPKFFVAENVPGLMSKTHREQYEAIKKLFEEAGYDVSTSIVNASEYDVPQDRKRVIIVGYRFDLKLYFYMPDGKRSPKTLREAIADLPESVPALPKNRANKPEDLKFPNQEHMIGSYSFNYMSRNRVRAWDKPSFTVIASGRHTPQHPSAPPMVTVGKDVCKFNPKGKYRRLSVRECARIQTFPDDFVFVYDKVADAYKMIGNAVPVKLAEAVAKKIMEDFTGDCHA